MDQAPQQCAAAAGDKKALDLLLDGGARIDLQNHFCWTPTVNAAAWQCTSIVSHLLDVEVQQKARLTPLATLPNSISFDMRGFCKYKAIESMYLAGADLEVQDQDGNTALAIASTSGDTRSVKTLLHLGADRNSRDTNGFTPLVHAIRQLHVEICCILLEDGATEIDVKDDEGRTPLIHAVLGRSFQMRHDIEWEDEMMTEYVNWKFGLVESGSLSYSHEGDAHMTEDEFLEDD